LPPIRVRETSEGPLLAKEISLQCPRCKKFCYVKLPYKPTAEQRLRVIQAAITEHRSLCLAAPPEVERVYTVSYPR